MSARSKSTDVETTSDISLLPEEAIEDTILIEASQLQLHDASQHASEPSGLNTQNGNGFSQPEYVSNSPSLSPGVALQDADRTMEHLRQRDIAVIVPPVEQRSDFQTYQEDPIIRKIIEESEKTAELQYLVKFHGGKKLWVSTTTNSSDRYLNSHTFLHLQCNHITIQTNFPFKDNVRALKAAARWIISFDIFRQSSF